MNYQRWKQLGSFIALDGSDTWVCGHVAALDDGSTETGIRAYTSMAVSD